MDYEWMRFIHERVKNTVEKTKQKTTELTQLSQARFEEFKVIKSRLVLAELRFWQIKYQASGRGEHWVYWDVIEYMNHSQWTLDQQITFLIAFQDLMVPEFEHLIIINASRQHTILRHLTREVARYLLQEKTPISVLSYVIAVKKPHELNIQSKK